MEYTVPSYGVYRTTFDEILRVFTCGRYADEVIGAWAVTVPAGTQLELVLPPPDLATHRLIIDEYDAERKVAKGRWRPIEVFYKQFPHLDKR